MHPFVRNLIIGGVGLILAAGLVSIAVLQDDSGLSVTAMLVAGLISTGVGLFLFIPVLMAAWVSVSDWTGRGSPFSSGVSFVGTDN